MPSSSAGMTRATWPWTSAHPRGLRHQHSARPESGRHPQVPDASGGLLLNPGHPARRVSLTGNSPRFTQSSAAAARIFLTRVLVSASARSMKHWHRVRSSPRITHRRMPDTCTPRATAIALTSMKGIGMLAASSLAKSRASFASPSSERIQLRSPPSKACNWSLAARICLDISASSLQLFRRVRKSRVHVACVT